MGVIKFSFIASIFIVLVICINPSTGAALIRAVLTHNFFHNNSCFQIRLNNRYMDSIDPHLMMDIKDSKTEKVSILLNNDEAYYVRKISDPVIYRVPSHLVLSLTRETCTKEPGTNF